jgi:hypothetical protein
MPSISGRHNRRFVLVKVAVVNAATYSAHRQSDEPVFKGAVAFDALVDTGTTTTLISEHVVARTGLEQVSRIQYAVAGGTTWLPSYLFQVGFYEQGLPPEGRSAPIRIFRDVINGGKFGSHATFDVLLGMDILSKGDLCMKRDGQFSFSF